MGICASRKLASLEIHQSETSQEDALYCGENDGFNELPNTGSLYSLAGTKGQNQDAAVLYQGYGAEGGVFSAVFDGHGKNGHIVSKFVRNRLPSLILNQRNTLMKRDRTSSEEGKFQDTAMESKKNLDKWREACVSAYKVMDKELKLAHGMDCSSSGTTAVVVIKQGEDLVIANLGDSRAMLGTVTEDGSLKAVPLTTDLKPCVASEAERIRKNNGRVLALQEEPHIQRVWLPLVDSPGLAMSRAFGDYILKNHGIISIPEISYRCVTDKDRFLVLASDGVWDVMSNDEVALIVSSAGSEEEAAKAVVDTAISTWKHKHPSSNIDDCTAVCLFLNGPS